MKLIHAILMRAVHVALFVSYYTATGMLLMISQVPLLAVIILLCGSIGVQSSG